MCKSEGEIHDPNNDIIINARRYCTGCTNFALLMSGGGVVLSHNAYVKAYNGIDLLTIINTEKDIKTHLYENIRHAEQVKTMKYEWTWSSLQTYLC